MYPVQEESSSKFKVFSAVGKFVKTQSPQYIGKLKSPQYRGKVCKNSEFSIHGEIRQKTKSPV